MCDFLGVPDWLSVLLTEKFFNACIVHAEERKNEKNVLCLDCCEGVCPNCSIDHRSHRLLQIRRYVYHDVLRLGDADKLINCSQVQTYYTNGSKVVFLNQRPLSRPAKHSGPFCSTCSRTLHEPYLYCCIYCKLQDVLDCGSKVSKFVRESNNVLAIPEPDSEDGQRTPDSGITGSLETESSGSTGDLAELVACTATTEIARKKGSKLSGSNRFDIIPPACSPVHEILEFNNPVTEIARKKRSKLSGSNRSDIIPQACSPVHEILEFNNPVTEIARKKRSKLSGSNRSDIIPPACSTVHEIREFNNPVTEIATKKRSNISGSHQSDIIPPACSPVHGIRELSSPITEIPEHQLTSTVCEMSEPAENDMILVYKISGGLMKRRKCTKPQRSPLY